MICDHKTFEADVKVARISGGEDSGFYAQVVIACEQCGALFRVKELVEVPADSKVTLIAEIELKTNDENKDDSDRDKPEDGQPGAS